MFMSQRCNTPLPVILFFLALLIAALVVLASIGSSIGWGAEPISYEAAYEAAQLGQPLVCIVSASYCGPCHRLIGRLKQSKTPFCVLQTDKAEDQANLKNLPHGGQTPETVIFYRDAAAATGWNQKRFVGDMDVGIIEAAVAEARKAMEISRDYEVPSFRWGSMTVTVRVNLRTNQISR